MYKKKRFLNGFKISITMALAKIKASNPICKGQTHLQQNSDFHNMQLNGTKGTLFF